MHWRGFFDHDFIIWPVSLATTALVLVWSSLLVWLSPPIVMFAELDAAGWAVILTAGFSGAGVIILQVWTMWLAYRREKDKLLRDIAVAAKVEEVAVKQNDIAGDIHKATNGLTDRLIRKTEQEAHARGRLEQLERSANGSKVEVAAVIVANMAQTITGVNPTACLILGYPDPHELIGQPIRIIVPERLWPRHNAAIDRVINSRLDSYPPKTLQTVARRKDGKEVAIEVTVQAERTGDEWVFAAVIKVIANGEKT